MALCSVCRVRQGYSNQRHCLQCHADYMREWRKTHPLTADQRFKDSARSQVSVYVKRGKMARPSVCDACKQAGRIEAHHEDYAKPLEVIWLCRPCHSLLHRLGHTKEIQAQRRAA